MALRTLAALALAALVLTPAGIAHNAVAQGVPSHLHAFLLRADEPVSHLYPRTPSFAWTPAPDTGGHYQFELATSRTFEDATVVFKDTDVPIPAETIARQLPWMTGSPYALWAHVRWVSSDGSAATRWSAPFGFNLRWLDQDVPSQLPAPEGLIRWKPTEGATAYQVVYTDIKPSRSFETTTNVADEREFFTLHSAYGSSLTIHWRVRAIRDVSSTRPTTNEIPAVSYGPWSPVFTTVNTPQATQPLSPSDTISDTWAIHKAAKPFALTPAFAWAPSAPDTSGGVDAGSPLYRVYIFTDNHCVNQVFAGSIVGSPAFAPRITDGTLALPATTAAITKATQADTLLAPGSEGTAVDATGDPVTPAEAGGAAASSSSSSSSGGSSSATTAVAQVDLRDSGWPSGRYYWTVVPVTITATQATTTANADTGTGTSDGSAVTYEDDEVPQDACEAGNVMSFGKVSRPVVTSAGKPFVSGVAPTGRLVAAVSGRTTVYTSPVVAWEPAMDATSYQVELSRTAYPWRIAKRVSTPATALTLPLGRTDAGTWYYRVRGIDTSLPVGARAMSWSTPVRVRVTGNRFAVVK